MPSAGNRFQNSQYRLELLVLSLVLAFFCFRWMPLGCNGYGFCVNSWCERQKHQKSTTNFEGTVHARHESTVFGRKASENISSQSHQSLFLLSAVFFALVVFLPSATLAVDRTVAPPTCPSMPYKCKPREGRAALQKAEARLEVARRDLSVAEGAAGGVLTPGDARPGIAEVREFWNEEVQRLKFNRRYLENLRGQLSSNTSLQSVSADMRPLRLISRLAVRVPDVAQEAKFWCEGVGMQLYSTLQDGGVLVAFGPPGIAEGDEGGFFALEIHPSVESNTVRKTHSFDDGPKLSFLQLAIPNQIRPYKVFEAGGKVNESYGYFQLSSPAGICVRAYIDDRRDPVEFVALAAAVEGKQFDTSGKNLIDLGLHANGSYRMRSPVTQSDMPLLPGPNQLYGNGDPALSTQVLLLPLVPEAAVSYEEQSISSSSITQSRLQPWFVPQGITDPTDEWVRLERPSSPVSGVEHVDLITYGPSPDVTKRRSQGDAGRAVSLELKNIIRAETGRD